MADFVKKSLVTNAEQVIENIENNKGTFEFLETGIETLDKELDGGFLKKEIIILGGHTGIGKSYIAGQFMYHIAQQGYKTAYFSLEISNEMVVSRTIGALANVKPIRIRMGTLEPHEIDAKNVAKAQFLNHASRMFFYDEVYTLETIIAEIKKNQYDFVVVDFIQNIIGGSPDEYSRLSNAALILQKAAKETNSCIFVLSQLSNSAAKDNSGTGVLEYKGTGSIATVCDLGFVIQKTDFNQETNTLDHVALRLRKNRRGRNGLEFILEFQQPGGWIKEAQIVNQAPPEEEQDANKHKRGTAW